MSVRLWWVTIWMVSDVLESSSLLSNLIKWPHPCPKKLLSSRHVLAKTTVGIFVLSLVDCCLLGILSLATYWISRSSSLPSFRVFVRAPPSQLSAKVLVQLESLDILFFYIFFFKHTCTSTYSSTSYWTSKTIMDKCRCMLVLVKPLRYQTQNVLVSKSQKLNLNLKSEPLSSSIPFRCLSSTVLWLWIVKQSLVLDR